MHISLVPVRIVIIGKLSPRYSSGEEHGVVPSLRASADGFPKYDEWPIKVLLVE